MKEKRKKVNCELGQAKTGKGIMRNFMEIISMCHQDECDANRFGVMFPDIVILTSNS